jgi:Domain of unknown function (DUF4278)
MRLIYRGNTYEVSAPIQLKSDSTTQPQAKLCYRGTRYESISSSVVISEVDKTDCPKATLSYRGNRYQCKISTFSPSKTLAFSWRKQ